MTTTVLVRRLGVFIFAVLLLGAMPGASIEIPEKPRPDESPRGAVLTGQAALDVAQIVCRYFEPGSISLWEPDPAEIARLEKLLPEFMAGQKTPEDYQPLHEYYRQYVGVVRDGKKRICVNFFHYGFVKESVQRGREAEDFWKRDPIIMDDGGAYYFFIQFDLETGTFSQLRFNGYA